MINFIYTYFIKTNVHQSQYMVITTGKKILTTSWYKISKDVISNTVHPMLCEEMSYNSLCHHF
jgi:hypothetical protein